jgi:hypothetical protein
MELGEEAMANIAAVSQAFGPGAEATREYLEVALHDFLIDLKNNGGHPGAPRFSLPLDKSEARVEICQWLLFPWGEFDANGIGTASELADELIQWFGPNSITEKPVTSTADMLLREAAASIWELDVRSARDAIEKAASHDGWEKEAENTET